MFFLPDSRGHTDLKKQLRQQLRPKPEQPNPKLSNEDLANALIDDLLLNALERLQRRKETFEVCKEIDSGLFDKAVEKVETTEMCKDIINGLLFDAAVQQIEPLKEEKVFEDLFDDAFKLLLPEYNQEREMREYFHALSQQNQNNQQMITQTIWNMN